METQYKGNDKLIAGIMMGVVTFWLFAQAMVNIVPAVQADLGISSGVLSIAISLTSLFSGMFMVAAGGLADKYGRVKLTNIGLILSIIGSLCLVFANGAALLIIGRIIQGLSAACIMPATLALMKTYFDGAERQRALSFWSIGSWGGSGICSFFGGLVATYFGWRAIFVVSIFVAALGMFLLRGTPESKFEATGEKKPFDIGGLVTFALAMLAFNIIVGQGAAIGWTNPIILGLAALLIVSVFLFVTIEKKHVNSFIDFSLFKNKAYSGATLSNFLLNASAGTMVVANTYVQMGRGFSSFQSGLLTIGYLVCVLSSIRLGEKALQKFGSRKPMVTGSFIATIGIALMAFTFVPGIVYNLLVFVGYALYGFGLGIYATPSTDTAISNAPADKVGSASGIYKMASSLGGAVGVALSSSLFNALSAQGNMEISGSAGLMLNVAFGTIALASILLTAPKATAQVEATE